MTDMECAQAVLSNVGQSSVSLPRLDEEEDYSDLPDANAEIHMEPVPQDDVLFRTH